MALVSAIFTAVSGRTGETISTTSSPTEAQCIQFLNEDIEWLTSICAEEKSDIGQSLGEITTVDGTSEYDDLSGMYCTADYGYVIKDYSRDRIKLVTSEKLLEYSPDDSAENEPCEFYVDGSNNVILLPTPDDEYDVVIPYWAMPTDLTATTDTVPFNGVFDGLLIEHLTMRWQNTEEYELDFEYKWLQFLLTKARRLISMRKGRSVGVSL